MLSSFNFWHGNNTHIGNTEKSSSSFYWTCSERPPSHPKQRDNGSVEGCNVVTFSDVLYEGLLTLSVEIGGWVRNGVLWRERRLQRHGIESVELLAVQLFPQTSPSVAEPHLNSSLRQFCPVKEDSNTQQTSS